MLRTHLLVRDATGRAPIKLPVDDPRVIRVDVFGDRCMKFGSAGSVETKIGLALVTMPLPGPAWWSWTSWIRSRV